MIAMIKLAKAWFHSTFFVNFHEYSLRNFKSSKQLLLDKFWITASNDWVWIDNFKYQVLTIQNQKVVAEEFPNKFKFFRTNYNSKAISTCYGRPDTFSHVVMRTVSSAQIAVLQRILSGRQLMQKEMNEDRILIFSRGNGANRRSIVLWKNS